MEDTIRLIRLHPSSESGSPLHCTIFNTKLNDAPRYTALSYAWGSQGSNQPLYVTPGSPHVQEPNAIKSQIASTLKITISLFHALQRLRNDKDEVVLWVDAICINQLDVHERNIQTAQMRRIYLNAERVAVWLGLEYNESAEALALTREIVAAHSTEPDSVEGLFRGGKKRG